MVNNSKKKECGGVEAMKKKMGMAQSDSEDERRERDGEF
jgi:hypothetical protein